MHMSHVWSGVRGEESEIFLGRGRARGRNKGKRVGSIIYGVGCEENLRSTPRRDRTE